MKFPDNFFSTLVALQLQIASSGALLFYSGTPAARNLVASLAATNGVDQYGNSYPAGFSYLDTSSGTTVIKAQYTDTEWFIQSGIAQILAEIFSGQPLIKMATANPNISVPNEIQASPLNTGGNGTFDQLVITGSFDATNLERWFETFQSASKDATTRGAWFLQFNTGAATKTPMSGDASGMHIIGDITAIHRGTTVNYSFPFVAESWQTPASLNVNYTVSGLTNPIRYRAMPDGTVLLDGEIQTTGAGPWPANTDLFSVAGGYQSPSTMSFITRSSVVPTGGQSTVNVLSSGSVQNGVAFTAAGQSLWFTNCRYPLT